MKYECIRKTSKSKRKNITCKQCPFYQKVAWPDGQKKWRCTI